MRRHFLLTSVYTHLALCALFTASSLHAASYQEEWPGKSTPPTLITSFGQGGNYLHSAYTDHIDKESVQVILEVGSRDALDALQLSAYYHTPVYAFECNPPAIQICEHNIGSNPNVILVPYAAWNHTEEVSFYPALPTKHGFNLGGSSLFVFNPKGPDSYPQSRITVPAIRLDEWCQQNHIPQIDLLCMDTQGATLPILEGLGAYLSSVKYIITEADYQRYYLGEALYPEINAFLVSHGFTQVCTVDQGTLYGNPLYVRNDLLPMIK